ncbi:Undecaprenyl diphosphate synthase family protein [Aphelenchoides avenae]|nr:Undecaprenyl diphosphate synthase family protein [Aphelenchus avenae]
MRGFFDDSGSTKIPWWGTFAKRLLKRGKTPKHIAFVMDGNRRYARTHRFSSVVDGHARGFDQLTKVLSWCRELGIEEVTVYAFSIENFKRSPTEVEGLMRIMETQLQRLLDEKDKVAENAVRFRFFGNLSLMPMHIQRLVAKVELQSRFYCKYARSSRPTINGNFRGTINVCISYTAQDEIVRAMQHIQQGVRMGMLDESDITQEIVDRCLDTRNSHPVDMLIRTSEHRLSDFLLWQCSSTYVHFEDILWPDFDFWHLFKACVGYQKNIACIEKLNTSPPTSHHGTSCKAEKFLDWLECEKLSHLESLASASA